MNVPWPAPPPRSAVIYDGGGFFLSRCFSEKKERSQGLGPAFLILFPASRQSLSSAAGERGVRVDAQGSTPGRAGAGLPRAWPQGGQGWLLEARGQSPGGSWGEPGLSGRRGPPGSGAPASGRAWALVSAVGSARPEPFRLPWVPARPVLWARPPPTLPLRLSQPGRGLSLLPFSPAPCRPGPGLPACLPGAGRGGMAGTASP